MAYYHVNKNEHLILKKQFNEQLIWIRYELIPEISKHGKFTGFEMYIGAFDEREREYCNQLIIENVDEEDSTYLKLLGVETTLETSHIMINALDSLKQSRKITLTNVPIHECILWTRRHVSS